MESDRLSSNIFGFGGARTSNQICWSSRVVSISLRPRLKRNYRISFKDPLTCILKPLLASYFPHTRAARKMRGRTKFNYGEGGYEMTLKTVCGYIYHKYTLCTTPISDTEIVPTFLLRKSSKLEDILNYPINDLWMWNFPVTDKYVPKITLITCLIRFVQSKNWSIDLTKVWILTFFNPPARNNYRFL